MIRADWYDFSKKNKDRTKAFEDMCRILFLRDRKKSSYDYSYNINEAGLEFQPVFDEKENKWYGAQCKYFITESNSTKYNEIYKSLIKAIKYFKNKLDVIYVYTNAELKHKCTNAEIDSSSNSTRIKITREAEKNNIDIKWLQPDNILDMVKDPSNLDLYKMYFSDSRECELVEDVISIKENTFLQSNEFLNLRFTNGESLESLILSILECKFGLILGEAGTGKSMGIKKLYKDFSDKFNAFYFGQPEKSENVCIPIFIRLRECIRGDLENLIRERLNDYGLDYINKTNEYFYLLDGLDELPYHDVSKIFHFIKQLSQQSGVKGIVISSRSDSSNFSYFRQEFSWNEYIFDKLKFEDINSYFESKNDHIKSEKLKDIKYGKLIKEIDDIFSVNLLWKNIERINSSTSKIEIIELAIIYWIKTYSKLNELSLLEPKQEKICGICQEISFLMQKKISYSISIDEAQKLIKQEFDVSSAKEINLIIEALTDLFFECSKYGGLETMMSFRHKRFQEFFLYQKIEKEYYNNPSILRELKLFSNRDFMINIFLRTSLNRAESNKNIYKCLALRLLEGYLGAYYISEYKDDLIGRNKSSLYIEPSYSYSKAFLRLLSTYDVKELDVLLGNENLNISDAIITDNFAEFVEIYHRINGQDISGFAKQKLKLRQIKVTYKNIDKLCYYLHNVKNEKIGNIHERLLSKSALKDNDVKNMDYVARENQLEHSFIKVVLEFELEYLTGLIENMDKFMLEVLCYNLVQYQYINILLDDKDEFIEFRKKIIDRVETKSEEYYINTLVVYNFLSREEKNNEELKNAFNRVNQRNFPTWANHIELHILLAILQKDKFSYQLNEFRLGVEIAKIVYDNYQDKNVILKKWLEVIKPYNYIYKEWLKYNHSYILGVFIAKLEFDIIQLKSFLRELLNYESVIYIQTVLFTIYKYNKGIFEKVVNKGLLDKILHETEKKYVEDYDSLSESIFQLAVMYNSIDVDKKYELLIAGIDNSIARPAYRAEDLVSRVLPECLYLAHQNYWYDHHSMESKCHQLYYILEVVNKTTDRAGSMEYLKWVIQNCGIDNEFLESRLYDISAYPLYCDEKIFEYDMDLVNIDNIKEYYSCKVNNAPYNSIQFWRKLIAVEYEVDNKLSKLYETFRELNYPSYFGNEFIQYCYFPTAVLFEKEETREGIIQFIINQGGVYGIYNMIRVFFIIGDMKNGINYTEHLFKFCNLLINKSDIKYDKEKFLIDKNEDIGIDEYIKGNWIIDESQNEAVSKLNPNVKISWNDYDEKEEFRDEWATCHPDKSAYRYHYKLFIDGNLRKRFSLVWVDGFRAALPIPQIGTNDVKREDYLLSRIFNHHIEELNAYMISSGLVVQ